MIISKNTEFATMREVIIEDFNNALDAYGIEGIKPCERGDVYNDDEFIPSELIPEELVGADTDNLTPEQDELWTIVKVNYIDEYVELWDAMLEDKLQERKDAIQKDIEKGLYDEYREEYEEYKRNYDEGRDSAYGYAKSVNRMKDFQRMYGDGNPASFVEWLIDNEYIKK